MCHDRKSLLTAPSSCLCAGARPKLSRCGLLSEAPLVVSTCSRIIIGLWCAGVKGSPQHKMIIPLPQLRIPDIHPRPVSLPKYHKQPSCLVKDTAAQADYMHVPFQERQFQTYKNTPSNIHLIRQEPTYPLEKTQSAKTIEISLEEYPIKFNITSVLRLAERRTIPETRHSIRTKNLKYDHNSNFLVST